MKIETIEITDRQRTIEVRVILTMNSTTATIGRSSRRFGPDWEPIEATHARALRQAADWLEKGRVELRDTGGQYAART